LIRGYFSERTHPLLAPLVPAIRDMLREYEIASGGKIQVEIVDPRDDEELEAEANQVYGIQPSPFRVSDRYEASIINSYFDLLIRYGDQHVTLGFDDLIEVDYTASGEPEVRLRNLEYDLTRSIKKVVSGFQGLDSVFASIEDPIRLTFFVTPDTLPADLVEVPQTVEKVAQDLQAESGGKFVYEIIDVDAPDSPVTRSTLINEYGLYPIASSFLSSDSYYFDLVLQIGDEAQVLYPTGGLSEADIRAEIESALQRAAPGFLKTVGLWLPDLQPVQNAYGSVSQPISSWDLLQQQLGMDYTVRQVDLSTGRVPGDIDVLVIVAPQNMSDEERFAIDQYLMRGGSVVVAGGNYVLPTEPFPTGLAVEAASQGLRDMLSSYGVEVGQSMVFDTQNEPLPIQVPRTVGGMQVVELQELDYPPFVDVRSDTMDKSSPIVSNLPAVTMNWVSPLTVDETKNAEREVTILLQSTDESWLLSQVDVQPNPDLYPEYGFPVVSEQQAYPLAVSIHGSFESYFKDKASPFEQTETMTETVEGPLGTIEASPDTARLVVIGSAEFIDDAVLETSMQLNQDRYLNSLQFMQNAVDWSVEDEDLLSIRSRGTYARLLEPLETGQQSFWEVLNYAVVFVSLLVIGGVWTLRRRSEQPMELVEPDESEPQREDTAEESGGSHE
jgi:ABC-2 type transport system permease protein